MVNPKQYALFYTYDGKDPHIYLCKSKLSAQKEMLSSIAESYEDAVNSGYDAEFEVDNQIMSAKLTMRYRKRTGENTKEMFVCVVPVCE